MLERSAMKRLIEPAEVAELVAYLCSPAADFITGTSIHARRRLDRQLTMSLMPAVRDFLELLAREAAAVEFEGPLVAARTGGLPPDEIAELEETKVVALRVRNLLARRRRREEELSALYDTANDLAGLRDIDAVLRAIVHRARTLLGADVAYMTLTDSGARRHRRCGSPTDRSRRASSGCGSAWAKGLGGLVSQTATPYVDRELSGRRVASGTPATSTPASARRARRDPRRAAAPRFQRDRRAVRGQPRGAPVRPRGGRAAGLARGARRRRDRHHPAARRDPHRAGRAVRGEHGDPGAQRLGGTGRRRARPDDGDRAARRRRRGRRGRRDRDVRRLPGRLRRAAGASRPARTATTPR